MSFCNLFAKTYFYRRILILFYKKQIIYFRLGLQHENLVGYRPSGLPLDEVIIGREYCNESIFSYLFSWIITDWLFLVYNAPVHEGVRIQNLHGRQVAAWILQRQLSSVEARFWRVLWSASWWDLFSKYFSVTCVLGGQDYYSRRKCLKLRNYGNLCGYDLRTEQGPVRDTSMKYQPFLYADKGTDIENRRNHKNWK